MLLLHTFTISLELNEQKFVVWLCCYSFSHWHWMFCRGLAIGSLVQSFMLLKLVSKLSCSVTGSCKCCAHAFVSCESFHDDSTWVTWLVQVVEILVRSVRMKHIHWLQSVDRAVTECTCLGRSSPTSWCSCHADRIPSLQFKSHPRSIKQY